MASLLFENNAGTVLLLPDASSQSIRSLFNIFDVSIKLKTDDLTPKVRDTANLLLGNNNWIKDFLWQRSEGVEAVQKQSIATATDFNQKESAVESAGTSALCEIDEIDSKNQLSIELKEDAHTKTESLDSERDVIAGQKKYCLLYTSDAAEE